MAKVRMVNTRFWSDNFIREKLNPLDRYLFLYFLTNEKTDICGAYELPLSTIASETGIDKEMLLKMLERLKGKVDYIDGWVVIKNFLKYQNLKSPQVKLGVERSKSNLPLKIKTFLEKVDGIDMVYIQSEEPNLNLNSNLNLDVGDSKSPTAHKFSPVDLELASLLRDLITSNTPTFKDPQINKWADQVRLMREQDGRTVDQIRYLINWCQKDHFWKANILSTKKLREKFDVLVAQVKRSITKDDKKTKVAFS